MDNKLVIILVVLAVAVAFMYTPQKTQSGVALDTTSVCYQETATEANSCGALNTGSYSYGFNGFAYDDSCGVDYTTKGSIDGNWGTRDSAPYQTTNYIYINYSVPPSADSNSLFMFKGGGQPAQNISISQCWDTTKLQFKIESNSPYYSVAENHIILSCYSPTGWIELFNSGNGIYGNGCPYTKNYFYEEGMFWLITEPPPTTSDLPCYQETATESNTCGALGTGSYSSSGNFAVNPKEYMYDANYSSNAYPANSASIQLYANYAKNNIKFNSAVWQFKYGYPPIAIMNVTVPFDCYDYYPDKISLYASLDELEDHVKGYCYNGAWKLLFDRYSNGIYEEAIFWDMLSCNTVFDNSPCDQIVSNEELGAAVNKWLSNDITRGELGTAIKAWVGGG